jgi:hypothetical protein
MYTAISSPAARLPWPWMPDRLNQEGVTGNVPGAWRSTRTRPVIAKPARMAYSATAMATWVRAVSRMPATAITSIARVITVAMEMSAHGPPGGRELMTASTLGPMTSTPLTAPVT